MGSAPPQPALLCPGADMPPKPLPATSESTWRRHCRLTPGGEIQLMRNRVRGKRGAAWREAPNSAGPA